MRILNTILNVIFGEYCLFCKREGAVLCSHCLLSCPHSEKYCPKWTFPIYDFQDLIIKKSIWSFKYNNKKSLANVFAKNLYERIIEEVSDLFILNNFSNPLLIPIPISKERRKDRGYNQSELLTREIENISRGTLKEETGVLIRVMDKEHQADIKERKRRKENMKNVFGIKNEEKIIGRNIILIDDVTTTGATTEEARKVLLGYGARKVIAFTIAQ